MPIIHLNDEDKKLITDIAGRFERIYSQEMSLETVSELADSIMKAGDATNAYFAANTPWVLAKDENNMPRFKQVDYTTLDALCLIAKALYPLMPNSSRAILASMGVTDEKVLAEFKAESLASNKVSVPEPLFPFLG